MNENLDCIEMTNAGASSREHRKSGRASFDRDGRSVWEWQVSTGVFTRTITEDQMMDLARADLKLVDEGHVTVRKGNYASGPMPSGKLNRQTQPPPRKSTAIEHGPLARLLGRLLRTA